MIISGMRCITEAILRMFWRVPSGVGVAQEPGWPGPLQAPCQSLALPYQVADEGVAHVAREGDEDDDAGSP